MEDVVIGLSIIVFKSSELGYAVELEYNIGNCISIERVFYDRITHELVDLV